MNNPDPTPPAFGELPLGVPHPMAAEALMWFQGLTPAQVQVAEEVCGASALQGRVAGEIMGETLRRLLGGEPVSDRYLLGLCWALRYAVDVERRCPASGVDD